MAVQELEPRKIPRVTKEEFYPVVGDPEEQIRHLEPKLGPDYVEVFLKAIQLRDLVSISYRNELTGDEVVVRKSGPQGGHMEIVTRSDGEKRETGTPLMTNYTGRFYRQIKSGEPPLAKEGDTVSPNEPIGVAAIGKGIIWLYLLPAADFPHGARVDRFTCGLGPEGITVEKGKTVIGYFEKL